MAREQPIIARDFLGLGTIGNSTEMNEAEGRRSSLPDSGPSSFRVSKDCGTDMACSGGVLAPSMHNGAFLNGTAFAGTRHSIWNQAAILQYLASSRCAQEEKFVEHSAENAPERSHTPHPVQSWWCGDPSVKCSPGWCDDRGLLNLGNLQGAPLKNLTPNPMSNPTMQPASFSDSGNKRKSMAETTEMQDSAPLTMFYKGNVYVFNDIMAEKAQTIMLLAGGRSSTQHSVIDFLGSTCMPNANASNSTAADKTQVENQARCNIESGNAATHHAAGHGNASIMQLDFKHPNVPPAPASPGQPSVPKALPQARKASLTRFLEKRRERVQSKAPYFLNQVDSSSPEERFSSSNDIASLKLRSNMDEKRVTMSGWMERMTEYATSDLKEGSTTLAFV